MSPSEPHGKRHTNTHAERRICLGETLENGTVVTDARRYGWQTVAESTGAMVLTVLSLATHLLRNVLLIDVDERIVQFIQGILARRQAMQPNEQHSVRVVFVACFARVLVLDGFRRNTHIQL